jgi:outer membrane receptor protein involved in Fe transport
VVTEKLIDDRNLDTVKDVLRNTAGITFLAAEGGEEDIRLRGFSLAGTGDIFMDGMRDPAFYDRDTFNNDRIEVLRGSASMLFGRGSTGGAVNQVSKMPRLINEHEVTTTLGTHKYGRITGDFNLITGENAALRLNAMATKADNNGSGSSIDKKGIAAAYRFGIGTANEFSASLYHLDNNNGMNYGLPWIKPRATDTTAANTLIGSLSPDAYYGLASDYSAGQATIASLAHTHRFSRDSELKTQLRTGAFKRDQRAGTVRFAAAALQPGGQAVDLSNFGPNTVFTRGTQLKVQDVDTLQWQSDFTNKFEALGYKHELVAGVDFSREEKVVYGVVGANPAKPNTLAGTPDDGASMNEGARVLRPANNFESRAVGAYVQDLVQIAPAWKLLGGLRYDSMRGNYATTTPATGAVTATYQQKISETEQALWRAVPAQRAAFVPLLVRHLVQHLGRHVFVQRAERQHRPRAKPEHRVRRQAGFGRQALQHAPGDLSCHQEERAQHRPRHRCHAPAAFGQAPHRGLRDRRVGPPDAEVGSLRLVHVDAGGQGGRGCVHRHHRGQPCGRPPRPQPQAQRHGMEHLPDHAPVARGRRPELSQRAGTRRRDGAVVGSPRLHHGRPDGRVRHQRPVHRQGQPDQHHRQAVW